MLSTLLMLCGQAPLALAAAPLQEPPAPVPAPVPSPLDNLPADGAPPVTLPSGLMYSELTPGSGGVAPRRGDEVVVRYTGWLTDGTQFDSSNGQTSRFRLGQVIEGWNEGLTHMTPGASFKFTIPSALGYGERGSGASIPPNSDLIFLVDLVEVIPGPVLLDFVPLVGDAVQSTARGTRYQVLEPGSGEPIADDSVYALEFVVYTPTGEPKVASAWQGPIRNSFEREQIPMFKELRGLIREGADFVVEYQPAADAATDERPADLEELVGSLWHVKVQSVQYARTEPAFVKPDPAASQTSPGGYVYQTLSPGAGEACGEVNLFELDYVLFNEEGKAVDSSYSAVAKPVTGSAGTVGLPFLKELPAMMSKGQVVIAAMPVADFGPGAPPDMQGQTTCYWHLTVVDVTAPEPLPPFSVPTAGAEGTVQTDTGLLIQTLQPGTGPSPSRSDQVEVKYAGWLTDGTPFDSSFSRNSTSTFGVGGVIPGWTEALMTMQVGQKVMLYIPAVIAYGPRATGSIPPNSDLVFYVELVGIL